MNLKIKETIAKLLNFWSDYGTNNTTDSWVPVSTGTGANMKMQHRVIPNSIETVATKVGSYWTGGEIYVYREEHLVWIKFNGVTTTNTNRQNFARVPEGCRPAREAYATFDSYRIGITYDGYIWSEGKLTSRYDTAIYLQRF